MNGRKLRAFGLVAALWGLALLASAAGKLTHTELLTLTLGKPLENHTLYLLDVERGVTTALTDRLRGAYSPTLSPDGSTMAFIQVGDGMTDVFLSDLYDDQTRRLKLSGYILYTTWSPDGSQLAYVSLPQAGVHHNIYVTAIQDEQPRLVVDMDYGSNMPAWSPDGRYLVYVGGFQFDRGDLFVTPADCVDTCEADRLHFSQLYGSELNPSWSPDGKQIAFMLIQVGRLGIFTLGTDCIEKSEDCFEQTPRLLTAGDGIAAPLIWSADSQRILFMKLVRGVPEVFEVGAGCDAPLEGCAPVQLTHIERTFLRW